MNTPTISFIIPAYNEERHLPQLLDSIKQYVPESYTFEIIVADHSSQDNTVKIAVQHRAQVVTAIGGTVGGLRNLAAKSARGDIFVFLDADILLTAAWCKNFPNTVRMLSRSPITVTGSVCGIPDKASIIERYWFKPLLTNKVRYINSGHLVTTKKLFESIAGFSEDLQTGEDYDFSARAREKGAEVINNPDLYVIHKGYPDTIARFIRREIWHGKGDCHTLRSMFQSRVVLISMLFFLLHIASVVSFLIFPSPLLGLSGIIAIILLCLASAYVKHRHRNIIGLVVAAFLYYCYFSARAASCMQKLIPASLSQRHSRAENND